MTLPRNRNGFARRCLVLSTIALGGMLTGCSQLPEKRVDTSIDIAAPRDVVWRILTDIERYPEWNPYHVSVRGRLALDEPLEVRISKPNGKTLEIEPHVMRLEPRTELTWGGGVSGIFVGEHVFLLSEKATGSTHLVHKERFTGIAVPFAELGAIEEGYVSMNQALKRRAERFHVSQSDR